MLNILGRKIAKKENIFCVTGSRKMTYYGRRVVDRIILLLKDLDASVICGLDKGTDFYVLYRALRSAVKHIVVLPCGLNTLMHAHLQFVSDVLGCGYGSVICPFDKNEPPTSDTFAKKNTEILNLADTVIITEATINSRNLMLADMAADMGKDVYAIPGRIFDKKSAGCNRLIADGVMPFLTI